MPVAAGIQILCSASLKSCLCVALGIQLNQLHSIIGNCCQKRNIMLLCHGMIHGHIILIFHNLRSDAMGIVHRLRFHRRQRNTAAANHSLAGAVDHVSADRTYVQLGAQDVAGNVPVGDPLAVQQLHDGYTQSAAQGLKQGNVRQAPARFPFGDCLPAYRQFLGKLLLTEIVYFSYNRYFFGLFQKKPLPVI